MRAPSSFHSTDASPTSASAVGDVRRAGREHREDAAADLEPDAVQSGVALGERDHGRPAEVARQHRRPAYERGRHRRRPGDGVGHQARERALAQLADEQAAQEVGLRRRWPDRTRRAGSRWRPAAEPLPVVAWIRSSARSTSAIVSVGTAAGVTSSRNTVAQPDPDPALAGLAGEEPDRRPRSRRGRAGRADRRARRSWSSGPGSTRPRSDVATRSASSTASVCPIDVSLRARAVRAGACPRACERLAVVTDWEDRRPHVGGTGVDERAQLRRDRRPRHRRRTHRRTARARPCAGCARSWAARRRSRTAAPPPSRASSTSSCTATGQPADDAGRGPPGGVGRGADARDDVRLERLAVRHPRDRCRRRPRRRPAACVARACPGAPAPGTAPRSARPTCTWKSSPVEVGPPHRAARRPRCACTPRCAARRARTTGRTSARCPCRATAPCRARIRDDPWTPPADAARAAVSSGMRGVGDQHRGAELDGRRGTTRDRDRAQWVAEHRAREPQRRESRRLRFLRLFDDALDGGRAGAEPDPHPSMIARLGRSPGRARRSPGGARPTPPGCRGLAAFARRRATRRAT